MALCKEHNRYYGARCPLCTQNERELARAKFVRSSQTAQLLAIFDLLQEIRYRSFN